ncbi:MAG TPA: hypothetical protein VK470_06965 [Bacteroidota bacterium]|nr:hypothetical protein [Bacteroidota bacterium]
MNRRNNFLSFVFSMLFCAGATAQTSIDQQLVVTQNDGFNGGAYTIALQVKAVNLTGANTLGSATIDVQFDPARLTYVGNTFGDSPSGISSANGYAKFVSRVGNTVRIGVTAFGVNGSSTYGTDLTTAFVTWASITFTIVNSAASTTISINPLTNQIGLFAQEGNSNGSGGMGSGTINNQTLNTPTVLNDISLPVELASFTVVAERQASRLNWKTATETNNAGFGIERADAALTGQSKVWKEIGFVHGAGTSSAEHNYTFLVAQGLSGRAVYRLKQIDRDGQIRYSHEVEAAAIVPKEFALMQNFPNPFNPSTSIGFSIPEDSRVSIVAYDVIGRTASVLIDESRPAGSYTLSFDAGALASGVYLYRMTARSGSTVFTQTKRFVLMR